MLVTLYPGADRDNVLQTLRDIRSAAQTASNAHGPAHNRLTAYLEWATNSVRMLEHRIRTADIDRLVLTRGYERLLATAGTLTGTDIGTQRVLNGLVDHEIQQRTQALEEAVQALTAQIRRWTQDATYTVADTSVYIEHNDKLRDLDFARPGGHRRHPAHLRHQPGREGTQRRADREEAHQAARSGTRRHPRQEEDTPAPLGFADP
jgi:hypothetical protein